MPTSCPKVRRWEKSDQKLLYLCGMRFDSARATSGAECVVCCASITGPLSHHATPLHRAKPSTCRATNVVSPSSHWWAHWHHRFVGHQMAPLLITPRSSSVLHGYCGTKKCAVGCCSCKIWSTCFHTCLAFTIIWTIFIFSSIHIFVFAYHLRQSMMSLS